MKNDERTQAATRIGARSVSHLSLLSGLFALLMSTAAQAQTTATSQAFGESVDLQLDLPVLPTVDISSGPIPYYAARDAVAASASVPVQGGQIQVGIQVQVVYIIK